MNVQAWISADPAVMLGKPVVAGTRVTVESILERLAGGETVEEMVASHPKLNREAILAALEYAALSLGGEVTYPFHERAALPGSPTRESTESSSSACAGPATQSSG